MSIYVNRNPNAGCWQCQLCPYRIHHDHPGGWKDAVRAHETAHREAAVVAPARTVSQKQEVERQLAKHRPLVVSITRSLAPVPGLGADDVEQEGLIALLEAYENYDPGRGVPFERFADTVIRLRFKDLMTKATRKKHEPLNTAIVAVKGDDGQDLFLLELLADRTPTPHRVAVARETLAGVIAAVKHKLTEPERIAIRGIINDVPYTTLAESFEFGERGVDNAVQRARRKLRVVIAGMG